MQRSTALVLDFDGTILDSEWPIYAATNELYDEFELPPVPLEEWRQTIGVADHEIHHDYLGRITDLHPTLLREELRARRLVIRDRMMAAETIRPGIEAWVDAAVGAGLPVGVASSSTPAWVEGNIERLGLGDRIGFISATPTGQPGKPDPGVYLRACAGLGVDPSNALAVEDSPTGLAAAIAAGMACITVPNLITADLGFVGSNLHVSSLADVDPSEWLAIG